jgi:hypothetical protein
VGVEQMAKRLIGKMYRFGRKNLAENALTDSMAY